MMYKKTLYAASAAMLLLAPATAMAQIENPFKAGTRDFSITGSGSSDESFDRTGFSTSFNLGYFFMDGLEGNIRQEITYADVDEGDDDFSGSTRAGIDYHFGDWRVVPFAGATFGYLYGDNVDDQFFAGPEAGLKYMLNPTTYVFGLVEYQILFDDDDNDGRFVYGLGLGLTF